MLTHERTCSIVLVDQVGFSHHTTTCLHLRLTSFQCTGRFPRPSCYSGCLRMRGWYFTVIFRTCFWLSMTHSSACYTELLLTGSRRWRQEWCVCFSFPTFRRKHYSTLLRALFWADWATLILLISDGKAHRVIVNSQFTADIFARTFPSLYRKGLCPGIVHPSVDTKILSRRPGQACAYGGVHGGIMFLSINRFERKKNLNLALRAYALFRKNTAASGSSKSRLVIAGGYDERLKENVVYLSELKRWDNSLIFYIVW